MSFIEIESCARLHLGFIDPGANFGRRFVSLGLAIEGLATHFRLQWAQHDAKDHVLQTPAKVLASSSEHSEKSHAHNASLDSDWLPEVANGLNSANDSNSSYGINDCMGNEYSGGLQPDNQGHEKCSAAECARAQIMLAHIQQCLPAPKIADRAADKATDRRAMLTMLSTIPAHAGLGSGTQLALALGWAWSQLTFQKISIDELAALSERGRRSGIGVGVFRAGGFCVDGGRGPHTIVPPIISRIAFPQSWRVILLFDSTQTGLHGATERNAFADLPPFPEASASYLAQRTLYQLLPALVEADLPSFGDVIFEVQRTVGDYFAPAQGGRYASAHIARWLAWFAKQGACCFGQSSWGPTGFVITAPAEQAQEWLQLALCARATDDPVRFCCVAGRNAGARMRTSMSACLHEIENVSGMSALPTSSFTAAASGYIRPP